MIVRSLIDTTTLCLRGNAPLSHFVRRIILCKYATPQGALIELDGMVDLVFFKNFVCLSSLIGVLKMFNVHIVLEGAPIGCR